MGGGRFDLLTSLTGAVLIGLLFFMAFLRLSRDRMRRSGSSDPDGLFAGDEADAGPSREGPPEFTSFAEALENYVAPLHDAHPDWERLDGAVGIPGRPAFRFDRNGVRFEVKGDAPFAPLLAARDWMAANPGKDPLEVYRTGRIGTIQLLKEVWPQQEDLRIRTN